MQCSSTSLVPSKNAVGFARGRSRIALYPDRSPRGMMALTGPGWPLPEPCEFNASTQPRESGVFLCDVLRLSRERIGRFQFPETVGEFSAPLIGVSRLQMMEIWHWIGDQARSRRAPPRCRIQQMMAWHYGELRVVDSFASAFRLSVLPCPSLMHFASPPSQPRPMAALRALPGLSATPPPSAMKRFSSRHGFANPQSSAP